MAKWVCENVLCANIEICQWENLHMLECKYRKRYMRIMLGNRPPAQTALGKVLRKRMYNDRIQQVSDGRDDKSQPESDKVSNQSVKVTDVDDKSKWCGGKFMVESIPGSGDLTMGLGGRRRTREDYDLSMERQVLRRWEDHIDDLVLSLLACGWDFK